MYLFIYFFNYDECWYFLILYFKLKQIVFSSAHSKRKTTWTEVHDSIVELLLNVNT